MHYCQRLILLASFFLAACLGPTDVGPGFPRTGERFSESMRWSDFQTAALYLQADAREVFLEQFKPDEDLHVVDSRVLKVDLHEDEGWAEAEYMMEYYHLPSTRVKKWYWTQHWTKVQEKMTKSGVWLIENAPPALPWNQ